MNRCDGQQIFLLRVFKERITDVGSMEVVGSSVVV